VPGEGGGEEFVEVTLVCEDQGGTVAHRIILAPYSPTTM